jgi:4-alpha-glucanotransferase
VRWCGATNGLADQINVPGTVAEHPNWSRRLPIFLEELPQHEGLRAIADTLAAACRGVGR